MADDKKKDEAKEVAKPSAVANLGSALAALGTLQVQLVQLMNDLAEANAAKDAMKKELCVVAALRKANVDLCARVARKSRRSLTRARRRSTRRRTKSSSCAP
jgi:hypothetical protein